MSTICESVTNNKGFKKAMALACMVQLVGASTCNQKVAGSIPGQGTCLGCSSIPWPGSINPWSGHIQAGGNQSMLLSCINVLLSPFHSL